MDDFLDEEQQIMDESTRDVAVLSSSTFENSIEDMGFKAPVTVKPQTPLSQVLKIMQDKYIGCVLVVSNNKVEGIFTERDLLFRVIGKLNQWEKVQVGEVMTRDPLCLRRGDEVAYAMNNMHVRNFRHIPIVDEKLAPVGIISIKDVMSYILDQCPHEVLNLTGEPYRGTSVTDAG